MMTHKEVSYDFNYISYTLLFYLIALAGYMLGGKKLWNRMVNVISKQKKKRIDCSNKNNIIIWILNICKRKQK